MSYGAAIEASRAEILREIIIIRQNEEAEALSVLNRVREEVVQATRLSNEMKSKLDEIDQK